MSTVKHGYFVAMLNKNKTATIGTHREKSNTPEIKAHIDPAVFKA